MPPLFYDEISRPLAFHAAKDGTVILTPGVVAKISVSKRARNTGNANMIRLNSFIDRGER